ncbi:hypothetical protein MPER_04909 [Moniliophthora perniciosa FA553]|nr:hypothetical protein MPER_04909 [Moniliophthora perniciosa FA553]
MKSQLNVFTSAVRQCDISPSAKVRKFHDQGLSLKGNKSKTRGWERRPVNIGSMRRQGPAANFVRNP